MVFNRSVWEGYKGSQKEPNCGDFEFADGDAIKLSEHAPIHSVTERGYCFWVVKHLKTSRRRNFLGDAIKFQELFISCSANVEETVFQKPLLILN